MFGTRRTQLAMLLAGVMVLAQATPSEAGLGFLFGGSHGSVTKGRSFHPRPLLSADQVRRFDPGSEILFVEGGRPVRAGKIVYHRDRAFAQRLLPPAQQVTRPPWRGRHQGCRPNRFQG